MVVCKADQIRNPKTGRCVSKTGKIGKSVLARNRSHPISPRRVSPRKSPKKKKVVPCKPNQVRNPKTGKCVSKTGKIGKAVLAKRVRSRSKTRSRPVSPRRVSPKRVRSRSKTRSRTVSPKRVRSFILPVPRTAKARTYISKAGRDAMNALGQMLFLSALYPNDCIPIATRNPKNYDEIGMVWKREADAQNVFQLSISINPTVRDQFKKCLKDEKKRFILIYLHLQYWTDNKSRIYHANFLIYDKNRNEIERFEPHGSHTIDEFDPTSLDTTLAKYFKDSYGIRYVKPLDFCPLVGPQTIQELGSDIIHLGEKSGFCQYWSFWYANIRLQNPNLERQDVIKRALLEMKKFPDEFTGYIINYASFFADVEPFLQNPQKLKELVKKFTTD